MKKKKKNSAKSENMYSTLHFFFGGCKNFGESTTHHHIFLFKIKERAKLCSKIARHGHQNYISVCLVEDLQKKYYILYIPTTAAGLHKLFFALRFLENCTQGKREVENASLHYECSTVCLTPERDTLYKTCMHT